MLSPTFWVRLVGVLSLAIACVGVGFLAITLTSILTSEPGEEFRDLPYFWHFFGGFFLANLAFVALLALASYRLLRLRRAGLHLLTAVLGAETVYGLGVGSLWLLPESLGMSAAAATGVGNMALAAQLFIGYPLSGLLIVAVLAACGVWKRAFADESRI